MYEVSFPTPRRPHVLMQLGSETISFDSYDESQLPLNGLLLCYFHVHSAVKINISTGLIFILPPYHYVLMMFVLGYSVFYSV